MVPTKLTLSNFMCYRADGSAVGPPTLDFDKLHVICLTGENGAGKSALLDAITWALWGKARVRDDDDLIAQGQAEMSVELEFLLGEQHYRVSRRRQRGGTGKRGGQTSGKSQLDLQVLHGERWRPIAETSLSETQSLLNGLLRMSYETFTNASFLLQGQADTFTKSTPADRKKILAEILDLGEYELLAQQARDQVRGLNDQLIGLRGAIEQLQRQAEGLDLWRAMLAQAELTVQTQDAAYTQVEADRSATERLLGELSLKASRRRESLRTLEQLRAAMAAREGELNELRAAISTYEALLARREAILAGLAQLAAARTEQAHIEHLREQHQQLMAERSELQGELRAAKAEVRADLLIAQQQRDTLQATALRQQELRAEVERLGARIDALQPIAERRFQALTERQELDARLTQLQNLRLQRSDLVARIERSQAALSSARAEQGRLIERLERQLADEPTWRQKLLEARSADQQLDSLEQQLAELRIQAQDARDHLADLKATAQGIRAEVGKLERARALLGSELSVCPVCRSDLGVEGLASVQAHYDRDMALLQERAATTQEFVQQQESRLQELHSAIIQREQALPALRVAAASGESLETQLGHVVAWRDELEHARSSYAELDQQLATRSFEPAAQAELSAVDQQLALLGAQAELERARRTLDERVSGLEAQLSEQARLEATLEARRRDLAAAEQAALALEQLEVTLHALELRLESGDFAHAIRQRGRAVEAAIAELGYSDSARELAATALRDLLHWEQKERELLLADVRLGDARRRQEQGEELQQRDTTNQGQLSQEVTLLEHELRDLPRVQARVAELQSALGEARRRLEVARNDRAEKSAHVSRAEYAAQEVERHRGEERRLMERQSLFTELAEAFGRKGVQAMLIETAIPQIEDEANRILGRMTDGQMHVSFEMQRDSKKGETIETLEIRIADTIGTRIYDAFSGGEAMRVNFAIRIALSRLLARRAGARLETLVIDEGFGTLDSLGRERMVEAITSVQGDFRRIVVITHIEELKDRFPVQIEIIKSAAGSRWELR